MDDNGLDEFKGEVDFDFFDDGSDNETANKPKDVVLGKPPAARKSPNTPTPVKTPDPDLSLDLKTSNSKQDDLDSDSYSSYSSVTDSDSQESVRSKDSNDSRSKSSNSKNKKHRSRSKSASSSDSVTSSDSESETESLSKISSVQSANDIKSKHKSSRRRSDSESVSASDSHSDVESESKPVNVSSGSNRRDRPMSSKNRRKNSDDAWTNGDKTKTRDVRRPNDKESRNQRKSERNKNERYTDSESEITDVSPLNSAPNSPRQKKGKGRKSDSYYKSNGHTNSKGEEEFEPERLDLNVLVDAVSELDKDKRIKANTRRVMFAPPKANDRKKRDNYSYTNERAQMIEKENRRLLNEILQHVEMREKPTNRIRYEQPVIRRMTPSAINRERQQRKIESENLAFLRRLKNIKPTKGMSKAEHDREYEKTMLYGVPISMVHGNRPKSRSSTPWDEMSMMSGSRMGPRTRSLNSVNSAASNSTVMSTQSTSRRPLSAKKDRRPEWSDRW